jgi:hypothetical protein
MGVLLISPQHHVDSAFRLRIAPVISDFISGLYLAYKLNSCTILSANSNCPSEKLSGVA